MKKTYYTYQDIEHQVTVIAKQMARDGWKPDYVVGLTRGGLLPAVMLSNWFGCPMETLKVQLRDGVENGCESNCWMAEDALGYVCDSTPDQTRVDPAYRKNILIVDDINDTGATLNWIKKDWQAGCLPKNSAWDTIWGHNVRVATLVDNESSFCLLDVNYSAVSINKANDDVWIVFPWEAWSDV